MEKQQILQWKLMETLLPSLKSSLDKWEKSRKLLRKVEETERQIKHQKNIMDLMGPCPAEELFNMLEEFFDMYKKNEDLIISYNKLKSELSEENMFYEKLAHAFDGMKITKKQLTPKEFKAILYFAMVTGIDRTQLFECFGTMYRHITYAWDKKIENN